LLADLSRARVGHPRRDDRGVVVTLRSFDGDRLAADEAKLVASALDVVARHPQFPVMVIVHHRGSDATRWQERGRVVVSTLRDKLGAERVADAVSAGAAAPLVDPKGKYASRNDRIELVFVSPGTL